MQKIYLAGPLTPRGAGNHAIEYLHNMGKMVFAARALIRKGWSPFCPALDFLYFVGPGGPTEKQIKACSIAWLKASDAVLMVGHWTGSPGAVAERDLAVKMGLRVYHWLHEVPHVPAR